jgi:hypothetical protein
LASLLAPVSLERFGDEYWGREPLYVRRDSSCFYDGLVSLGDLERYFSLGELFGRHTVEAVSLRWGSAARPPATLSEVNARLLRGDSLRLRRMECMLDPGAPIIALAREMESTLQHALNSVSCYIAPADAVGLGPHHDETEIFTLQIQGTKQWQIFHQVESIEPAMYVRTELGEPRMEIVLSPGDLLYVPHGFVHDVTSNETSFSITIVFDPFRWTFVLDALADRLANVATLARTMPIGIALGGPGRDGFRDQLAACVAVIRGELENFEDSMLVDALARSLLSRMSMPPGHAVRDTLRLNRITPTTLIRRRPEVSYHISRRSDTIALMLAGGEMIRAPSRVEPAFRALIASEEPFRVADMHSSLGAGAKVSLARTLISAGLLEFVNGDDG